MSEHQVLVQVSAELGITVDASTEASAKHQAEQIVTLLLHNVLNSDRPDIEVHATAITTSPMDHLDQEGD